MTDTAVRVTFVMPAYNAEAYIGRAIASVIAQGNDGWRLIVVDDCSSDSTVGVVESFAQSDRRIQLHRLSTHTGSAYQPRLQGVRLAVTELVAPIDADDAVAPGYVDALLDTISETGAEVVYPKMVDMTSGERILPAEDIEPNKPYAGRDALGLTLNGWKINCNGGVIDRELYLRVADAYGLSVAYSCADELLTRQLLFESPTVAFSEAEYLYRNDNPSVTRNHTVAQFDMLINNCRLVEFVRERYAYGSPTHVAAQVQNLQGIIDSYRLLRKMKISPAEKSEILEKVESCRAMVDIALLRRAGFSRHYLWIFSQKIMSPRKMLYLIDLVCRR